MKHRILFFSIFILANCLWAQNPVYYSITSQQGLPSNIVYSLCQDSKGFMWIAHDKGLSRYDGKDFITYTHPAMKGIAVTDVFEDNSGRLWCQNFIGQHFYMLGDSMHYAETIIPTGGYFGFIENNKGDFYKGATKQITIYDSKLQVKDSLVWTDYINSFLLVNDTLHFFSNKKLYIFYNGSVLLRGEIPEKAQNIFTFPLWLNNHLNVFKDFENGIVSHQLIPKFESKSLTKSSALVQTVNTTDDSLVWINTTSGTYVFDYDLKLLPLHQPLFPGKSISCIFRDNAGTYWISTTDEGILYVPDINTVSYSKTGETFTSICTDKANIQLWAGSANGKIFSLDINSSTFLDYANLGTKHPVFPLIYNDSSNYLLAQGKSFYALNKYKQLFEFPSATKDILILDKNHFATASTGSVMLIAPKSDNWLEKWKTVEGNKLESNGFKIKNLNFINNEYRARALEYNREAETFYAATSKGLWKITREKSNELFYNNEQIIASDLEWMGDTLCVSTFGQDLLFFFNNEMVFSIGAENSILKKSPERIKYHNGKLWAISENRLFSISIREKNLTTEEKTGLGNEEIRDLIAYKEKILIVTRSGIISFPEKAKLNYSGALNLYVEKIFCNGTTSTFEKLQSLSYRENNLKVQFSVPFFTNPERIDIYYNINNNGWKLNEKGSRMLNLLSLSPGDYSLQLKAIDDSGKESKIEKIVFSVKPPFWQTAWFLFFVLMLLTSGFYALYRYRLSLVEKQNLLLSEKIKLEKELHRSVLASIKSQMNPHFIFNSLNTIQSYIYLNEKENASHYLNKFSQLTRMVLDMSNTDKISLKEEIEALTLYLELEKMRFEESLEYKIETDKNLDAEGIRIPSMLIQPYIENAVKHGLLHKKENRKLVCNFSREDGDLIVTIDDNGIGRKRSGELNAIKQNKHQSFSTDANKKRLEILNKGKNSVIGVAYVDKTDESNRPVGTTVILRIPLSE